MPRGSERSEGASEGADCEDQLRELASLAFLEGSILFGVRFAPQQPTDRSNLRTTQRTSNQRQQLLQPSRLSHAPGGRAASQLSVHKCAAPRTYPNIWEAEQEAESRERGARSQTKPNQAEETCT